MKKTALIILALFLTSSNATAIPIILHSYNPTFKAASYQFWGQKRYTMDEIQYYNLKEDIKKNIKAKTADPAKAAQKVIFR